MEKAKAEAADAFRKVRRVAVAVFIIISPLLVMRQWSVVISDWRWSFALKIRAWPVVKESATTQGRRSAHSAKTPWPKRTRRLFRN